MFGRSTDGSSDNEAVKITNSLKPFIKKWFGEWGKSCVRSKKMTVTTAPNASTGLIGVTDAFSENEVFVKYMPNCASANVGDTVWCKWMYDNMQTLYADNMGSLNVIDNRTCSASLPSAGWYRVMRFKSTVEAYRRGATGTEVVFHITRRRTNAGEETHEIKMLCVYDDVRFDGELSSAFTSYMRIDKIRYTYDGTASYVDIHITNACPDTTVSFDVYCEPSYQSLYTAESLQSVADAPTGETVLSTYTFSASPKTMMKTLWTGTWASGSITVSDISQYTMFIVRMDGQGTLILAMKNGQYFRGDGGYSVSSSNEADYYLNATLSGNTLTMVDCHSYSGTGTRTARTVTAIIGII